MLTMFEIGDKVRIISNLWGFSGKVGVVVDTNPNDYIITQNNYFLEKDYYVIELDGLFITASREDIKKE